MTCLTYKVSSTFRCVQVFVVDRVHGFVEELVVENDPEFEWRDMIRQHRSSNESRQTLLYKLDATVRRQLGKKVRDAWAVGGGRD